MAIPGYGGRYIEVDLSSGDIKEGRPNEEILGKYIGGKWLASYYLYKNLDPKIDPLSPDNILFIAAGPATGSKVPLASKIGFFFKSPLTNIFGESFMGGNFPAAFRWLGIDYLVIRGASDKPVYLYIEDEYVDIMDASGLWGLNTEETEKALEKRHGHDIEVAEIGPAGEKLIRYAVISHGYGERKRESKAGRVGGGAVMGSKKLKAIVLKPSRRHVDVYSDDLLKKFVKKIGRMIATDPKTGAPTYRKYGTPATLIPAQKMGFLPSRYWRYGQAPNFESIDPDKLLNEYYDHNVACYNCPFACGHISKVKDGVFKGLVTKGPEYETIFSFGANAGISGHDKIISLNVLCDRYGVDTIDAGNIIAFAIEAYNEGRLKLPFPISYGDYEAILNLFQLIMERKDVGEVLGEGIKQAGEKLGLSDLAVHVKGLSLSAYDPRRLKGMAISYGIGTRGGGHLRTTAYAYEIRGDIDPDDTSREKIEFIVDKEDLLSLHDSLVVCRFARMMYTWDNTIEMIKALTGRDWNKDELKKVANETRTMIRLFNIEAGIVPEKDDMLPEKFFKEPVKLKDGREYWITEDEMRSMLRYYYELRGWDERGYPKITP